MKRPNAVTAVTPSFLKKADIPAILDAVNRELADSGESLQSLHDASLSSPEETKPWGMHMDFGTDASMQEVNVINAERINGRLAPLIRRRALLVRVLKGEVKFRGACEVCGNPIGKERLLLFPEAACCIGCRRKNGG